MARRGRPSPENGVPTPAVLLPGRTPDELKLSFAGNIVKHLGVQMYAGRPVPAIAELVSNAWDADARVVEVKVPLDVPWEQDNEKHFIEVVDNGNGMTWEMVRDAYLDVGRDRREAEKTDRSPGGRRLQGRKGIGKLAGFGICDTVEVQTVAKAKDRSLDDHVLIWFSMSLADLKKVDKGPAPVTVRFAGPVSKAPEGGRTTQGTTVVLRQLHGRRAQNGERFHNGMAQRFLLLPKFAVTINDQALREEKIKLQWRWPAKGWTDDEVKGCGPVQYWIGFTEKPRKQDEGELSGLLLYTRGKVSQEATFFEISGGVTGQHGLRYLVGMVKAEWLDEDGADLIATHRGSIAWESPQGHALQEWGQGLVRRHLAEWAKRRAKLREKTVLTLKPEVRTRIERLSEPYKDVAVRFIQKFQSVEMEVDEFEDLLSWFLDALENATLRNIIEKLRHADVADVKSLDDIFERMQIRTAANLLKIVDANLAAIAALEKMKDTDARERGVIAKHLERNPWLIHPSWLLSKADGRVTTWLKVEFKLDSPGKDTKDRADYFCVAVGGTLHIVEIKRGAYVAREKDILQADKYRKYVEQRFKDLTEHDAVRYGHVQSHLVSAELHQDARSLSTAYADKGWVSFTTWDDLVERAKLSHQQFRAEFEAISKRAEPAAED